MSKLPYFKVIAQHCIILICGMITKNQNLVKFVFAAFNTAYRKIFCLPKWSSASTMYANHNICNFETTLRKNTFGFMQRLQQSINTIISTLYQLWIVRFDIWNSWIKSLYVTWYAIIYNHVCFIMLFTFNLRIFI